MWSQNILLQRLAALAVLATICFVAFFSLQPDFRFSVLLDPLSSGFVDDGRRFRVVTLPAVPPTILRSKLPARSVRWNVTMVPVKKKKKNIGYSFKTENLSLGPAKERVSQSSIIYHPIVHAAYYLNTAGAHGDKRAKHMTDTFAETLPNVKLVRFTTVPLTDPRMKRDRNLVDQQVYSNKLSHIDAWTRFASDPAASNDSWAIFLEDDVRFHPNVLGNVTRANSMLSTLFGLAKDQGFAYLGICQYWNQLDGRFDREWSEVGKCKDGQILTKKRLEGVLYSMACGPCAHGYAMTKWRAKTLWHTLAARTLAPGGTHCSRGPAHRLRDHGQNIYMDVNLFCWITEDAYGGAWLAGADWASLYNIGGHFGMLYQDRGLGQSIQY